MSHLAVSTPERQEQSRESAPLGYRFDAVPKVVRELIAARTLKRIDGYVLAVLLEFRDRARFTAWTTRKVVAANLGCCDKTVQRSFARLEAAGLIAREALDGPDPDSPRNRTGWRFVFLWLAPAGYQVGPGVVRARTVPPPATTKTAVPKTRKPKPSAAPRPPIVSLPASPETRVSPTPEQSCPPTQDGINPAGRTRTSSSSRARAMTDDVSTPSPEFRRCQETACACFGPELGPKVAGAVAGNWRRLLYFAGGRADLVEAAIRITAEQHKRGKVIGNAVGYIWSVVQDLDRNGGVPPEPVALPKPKPPEPEYTQADDDFKAMMARRRALKLQERKAQTPIPPFIGPTGPRKGQCPTTPPPAPTA